MSHRNEVWDDVRLETLQLEERERRRDAKKSLAASRFKTKKHSHRKNKTPATVDRGIAERRSRWSTLKMKRPLPPGTLLPNTSPVQDN